VLALLIWWLSRRKKQHTKRTDDISPYGVPATDLLDAEEKFPITPQSVSDSAPWAASAGAAGGAQVSPTNSSGKWVISENPPSTNSASVPTVPSTTPSTQPNLSVQAPVPAPATPSPISLAAFDPASMDYRPREKTGSSPSTVLTSQGPPSSNADPSHPLPPPNIQVTYPSSSPLPAPDVNTTSDATDLLATGGDGQLLRHPPTVSSTTPSAPSGAGNDEPSLSQISLDVNRILGQLGRMRVTPGEPVEEDIEDEVQPPLYGEHTTAGDQR